MSLGCFCAFMPESFSRVKYVPGRLYVIASSEREKSIKGPKRQINIHSACKIKFISMGKLKKFCAVLRLPRPERENCFLSCSFYECKK